MVLCRTTRGAIDHVNHPREPLKNLFLKSVTYNYTQVYTQ